MVPCQTSSLQCIRTHLWLSHEQHKIPHVSIAERESNGSSTHWLLFPICQLVKMIGQHKSFMWSQPVLFTLTCFFFQQWVVGFFAALSDSSYFEYSKFWSNGSGMSSAGSYFPLTMQGAWSSSIKVGSAHIFMYCTRICSISGSLQPVQFAEWKINYIMLATPSKYWWSLLFLT